MSALAIHRVFPRSWRWRVKHWLGLDVTPQHPELNLIDFRKGSRFVFDVGANRGSFVMDLLLKAPLSQVHCFEPNPDVFPVLASKCEQAGRYMGVPRAIANPMGVSSRSGIENLIRTRFTPASSMLAVSQASRTGWPTVDFEEVGRVEVPVVTIEHYAATNGIEFAKLLKIDTQGYEREVLRGCGEFLHRIEYVFAEVQFIQLYDGAPTWDELVSELIGQKFDPVLMGGFCMNPHGNLLCADMLWRNRRYADT